MVTAWDRFQELVKAEMRKVYSEVVVDHAMNPRNMDEMADADGFACITGPCGDTMSIWLKVRNDNISRATFITDGCGTTLAAGSMITEMVKGKTVEEALEISNRAVAEALGGLPSVKMHCSVLAEEALRSAVEQYLSKKEQQ